MNSIFVVLADCKIDDKYRIYLRNFNIHASYFSTISNVIMNFIMHEKSTSSLGIYETN